MHAVIAIDLDLRPVHSRFGCSSSDSLQSSPNFPPNSGGCTKQERNCRHESLSFAFDFRLHQPASGIWISRCINSR
jgi:hypothetical protein